MAIFIAVLAMVLVIVILAKTTRKVVDRNADLSQKLLEKEACSLLRSHPEYTIEAICLDAGFRSRRTFQTVFKTHLGIIPSEYRSAFPIENKNQIP